MSAVFGSMHLPVLSAAQGRCNDNKDARTVSIVITDSCPECEADHLDLQVMLRLACHSSSTAVFTACHTPSLVQMSIQS